jgi:hypothetical protein
MKRPTGGYIAPCAAPGNYEFWGLNAERVRTKPFSRKTRKAWLKTSSPGGVGHLSPLPPITGGERLSIRTGEKVKVVIFILLIEFRPAQAVSLLI